MPGQVQGVAAFPSRQAQIRGQIGLGLDLAKGQQRLADGHPLFIQKGIARPLRQHRQLIGDPTPHRGPPLPRRKFVAIHRNIGEKLRRTLKGPGDLAHEKRRGGEKIGAQKLAVLCG